jgi:fatty acid-binding protein DegV
MRPPAICTDSSALFPEGRSEPAGVRVVPIRVMLDGQPYEPDDVDCFYARLARGSTAATSTPSPGDFLAVYRRAAEEGAAEVASVHVDARLSATVASAELAAREAPIRVTVVDSGTASFGLGVCVSAAADAVSRGASAREAARRARLVGSGLRSLFVAPSAPTGRITSSGSWDVLALEDGATRPVGACDSPTEAAELMAATILSAGGRRRVAVGHASASVEPWADALAELVGGEPDVEQVIRYRLTAPVGAHTGPQCFGAFWWPSG